MSPARTSAVPSTIPVGVDQVADDDARRQPGGPGDHAGGRGVLLLVADDAIGVGEELGEPEVGVTGRCRPRVLS